MSGRSSTRILIASLALTSLLPLALAVRQGGLPPLRATGLARFEMREHYSTTFAAKTWPALDAFSALPDDTVIATTEVGLPSVLNPRKRVIDLAGLNDTHIALKGFSVEWLLDTHPPDVIYLPHPHYTGMTRALYESGRFTAEYDLFPAARFGESVILGVALRRDSPHFSRMRAAVENLLTL